MLAFGWRVFFRHVDDVLERRRVRRAAAWSGAAGVVALALMLVLEARLHWTEPGHLRSVAGIVLLAAGVGLLTFACFPTRRPPDPSATINGRQVRASWQNSVRTSVQPYLERRPRPVAPDDREAVRTDTVLLRRGLIGTLARITPLLLAGLAAVLGGLLLDYRSWFPAAFVLLHVLRLPEYVVRLGRAERARIAAGPAE
ncbi:hypothetical protein [Curtobacterium sp. VKM Ac-1393]|uniref:hypothetical protein n=1 Tax=Curtobacterium sp. VKM Ac-1393 TaxID=2783814 RepID=UPI00188B5F6F|nr:hypothetical protein [Curtobacterium sp. VKM Ac-1393]MBF4606061.1 hypothetical protein [Curtobacterium sp. VKM Ac-1393]